MWVVGEEVRRRHGMREEEGEEDGRTARRSRGDSVEIMDIPYLHGDGIWAAYRILHTDKIFYMYREFVS